MPFSTPLRKKTNFIPKTIKEVIVPQKANHTDSTFPYPADYITTNKGEIKSVILDYATFQKIEKIMLDYGLGKAMQEAEDDDEIDLQTAQELCGR